MRLLHNKRLIRRVIIAVAALGLAVPATIVVVKNVTSYTTSRIDQLFTPNGVTFEVNNISNQTVSQEIMKFVTKRTTQESLLHFNADQFFTALKKHFAIVKRIDWQLRPTQVLHLTIIGHTPFARVNNQFVLGEENQLLNANFFDEQTLQRLPTITINTRWIKKQTLARHAANFVYAVSAAQWAAYTIIYHAPWNIEAIPHQSICKCRLIADTVSFFEEHKFTSISPIFKDLCADGLISKKMLQSKGIPIGFDVRIKNQVIVQFYEQVRRGGL